jgi:hypothetical protein
MMPRTPNAALEQAEKRFAMIRASHNAIRHLDRVFQFSVGNGMMRFEFLAGNFITPVLVRANH